MENNNKLIADFLGLERSAEDPDYKVRIPHFFIDDKGNWKSNIMVTRRDFSEYADTYQDDKGNGYELSFDELDFNTSWDWLMYVVEKIESLGFDILIESRNGKMFGENNKNISLVTIKRAFDTAQEFFKATEEMSDTSKGVITKAIEYYDKPSDKLQATYKAVVKFIEWYNNQKS